MNVGTYIHAKLFHSTTAATKLATHNPEKYSAFASGLISAKNKSNSNALVASLRMFNDVKLDSSQLAEVVNIRLGSVGSSRGAVRGAADLLERHSNHVSCVKEINRLVQKTSKYASLLLDVERATKSDPHSGASKVG